VDQSVWAFLRRDPADPNGAPVICVFNATPVPRDGYWIGVPEPGTYVKILDTDAAAYGGSGYHEADRYIAEAQPSHGHPCRLQLTLPPLAAVFLRPDR
jgi:1,4-alpha-glucan branching enzyme